MWLCRQCAESIEDQFDACWNCGTRQDGSANESFDEVVAESAELRPSPQADRRMFHCHYCGGRNIQTDISLSLSAEVGSVGLDYRSLVILNSTEPLLADLCDDCGTVLRFHVQTTGRPWLRGK